MSKQQFWKGLAMLLVSMLLTALSQTPVDVALLFVTGMSALFGYIGKNILFVTATTTLTKIVSGLLIVFGTALTESIGMIAVGGVIIWPVLFKVLAGVFLTYIVTTFLLPPATQSKQISKVSLS
jgi:hypothetical protein